MSAQSADERPALGLSEVLSVARRRKFHFALTAVVVLAVAVAVIFALPPVYRSTASILIESQQIPTDLVRSTITSYAEERIEFIRQKVLTRANILEVIEKHNVYAEDKERLSRSDLVERFRDSNQLELISANAGRNQPTIAFTLSFEDPNPKTAQAVTNELVTMFLNENARTRADRAAETTEFLADEGERILADIQRMEGLIADFKQSNSKALPEVMQMNLSMLERLEREYQNVSLNIEGRRSDLKLLELQRAQFGTGSASTGGAQGAGTLAGLLRERERLLSKFTDDHPDVRQLERAIERARNAPAPAETDEASADAEEMLADPAYAALASQIESTRNQLAYLQENKSRLAEEIDAVSRRIEQAPFVEKEYKDLQRDLENLQAKYQEMRNKEMEARIAQNLEEDRKGERFSLLEPPIVPQEPAKPDRMKLLAVAGFLALAAGGGLVILLELLDPALRGQNAFVRELGVMPLVTIPYISTMADAAHRRQRIKLLIGAAAAGCVALLVAVHFLYMELDMLWYVALRRLSTL